MVRVLRNSFAAISGLVCPSRASRAMCSSCGVSSVRGVDLAPADLLARGQQLAAGALGEGLRAHRGEQVVGGAQLAARVDPSALAMQPLAVQQVGPGELGPQRGAAEPLDRLGVALLRSVPFAQQRSRARLQALRPVGTLDGRHRRQPLQRIPAPVPPPGPHGGLDEFGQGQLSAQRLVRLLGRLLRRTQRLGVPPEAVVQDRHRPSRPSGRRSPPRERSRPRWSRRRAASLRRADPGTRRATDRRSRPGGCRSPR